MTAREITATLKGNWHGSYGYVRCVAHPDKRPSLRLRDGESGKLLVHCHAGCDATLILDRLRAERVLGGPQLPDAARQAAEQRQAKIDAKRSHERTRAAYRLWRHATGPYNGYVDAYLLARGITLDIPRSIRACQGQHPDDQLIYNQLLAAVQQPDGTITGVQRIFLAAGGQKAAVESVKLSLGNLSGGAVRLAPADAEMAVGEGLETCLSFQQMTGIPTWAALSTSGVRQFTPPAECRHLHILVDNDKPHPRTGIRAGDAAADVLSARLTISHEYRRSLVGKDWNDALMAATK